MLKHEYAVPEFMNLTILVSLTASKVVYFSAKLFDLPVLTSDSLSVECSSPIVSLALHVDARGRLCVQGRRS